jgi:hypothetical protein
MNKFVSFLIVLLAIAVATPVLAEQRLSLGGEMRVRGWHTDIDANDYTSTFADQRLRIAGKMSVAEGVSVTFRLDATESAWGSQPGFGGGRLVNDDTSMQWDRAHLDLEKGMFHLRAGQQWVGFGRSGFDAQDSGLLLNIKAPVAVSLFYMLDKNNGGPTSTDAIYYGLQVGHKLDSYAANVFFAAQDDNNLGNEVYVIGGTFATTIADSVKLYTELEYFTGDHTATVDAYGLQAIVEASAAVADNVTVGGQFFYAMGDDEDFQYIRVGNGFNGWDPIFSLGTGLENEAIENGDGPYRIFGNGAGLYAGRLFGSIKATDEISFAASVFYGVADEKDVALYKNGYAFGAGMSYAFMKNTKLGVQLQYEDFSKENAADDYKAFKAGTGLFVSF